MGEGEVGIKHLTGPLKSLLLFLSILVLVIPAVWWCVESDSRIDSVEDSVKKAEIDYNKKFDKADMSINEVEDSVNKAEEESKEKFLEVNEAVEDLDDKVVLLEKHEIERMAEYKALANQLERFESTQQLMLAELKRLERGE